MKSWIIFTTIVGIVIALRVGWRPSLHRINWGWTVSIIVTIGLLLAIMGGVSSCNKKAEATEKAKMAVANFARTNIVEFPLSGEGHATKEVGLKVWLDPMKTYLRASKPARYVFVEDTDLFFDNTEGAEVETKERYIEWRKMPPGKYIVYPLKGDKLYFIWWQ